MQPNQKDPAAVTPSTSEKDRSTETNSSTEANVPVCPLIAQAMDAFYRDLPQLLKDHDRQWVAYHGDQRVGFGRTQTALYQRCLRDGIQPDEFMVLFVHRGALHDDEEVDLPASV